MKKKKYDENRLQNNSYFYREDFATRGSIFFSFKSSLHYKAANYIMWCHFIGKFFSYVCYAHA